MVTLASGAECQHRQDRPADAHVKPSSRSILNGQWSLGRAVPGSELLRTGLFGTGEPCQLDVGRSLTQWPEEVLGCGWCRTLPRSGFQLAQVGRKVEQNPQGSVTSERTPPVAGVSCRLAELGKRHAVTVVA